MSLNIDLSTLPLTCIWLLKDVTAGNALLQWSNGNALNHLAENITLLRRGIHNNRLLQHAYNRGNVSLEVIKEYIEPQDACLMRVEATLLFQNAGLIDMSGKYNNITYRVQTRVFPDYRNVLRMYPLVYVTLRSPGIGEIVAGIFEDMVTADEWKATAYPGVVDTLVIAENALTREYHKAKGYKFIRFKESSN